MKIYVFSVMNNKDVTELRHNTCVISKKLPVKYLVMSKGVFFINRDNKEGEETSAYVQTHSGSRSSSIGMYSAYETVLE